LIGASLIPRAEIAMIIMHKVHDLGENVVPGPIYSAMVFVSVLTCIISPVGVRMLFRRWPQK